MSVLEKAFHSPVGRKVAARAGLAEPPVPMAKPTPARDAGLLFTWGTYLY